VVRIEVMEERPGNAGNVAMNTVSLGAKATLGVTGVDEAADSLKQRLDAHGVKCLFTRVDGFTTVTKLRVLSQISSLSGWILKTGMSDSRP
jgi:D-beta-D-heptose 7-phosphate kinase / D-beta-D-heptose 1-phosphate adenosyltransferase